MSKFIPIVEVDEMLKLKTHYWNRKCNQVAAAKHRSVEAAILILKLSLEQGMIKKNSGPKNEVLCV